jgi:glycosyltransferase involved in cell wall biosynthesis
MLSRELRKKGIPYIFFTNQNIPKRYPWPFSAWEREVVKNSAGWIACGKTVWQTQVGRGFPEKSGTILPFAVDTEKFKPFTPEAKLAFQERMGQIQGPVIGYAGRLTEQKGIRILLDAVGKIPKKMWGSLVFFGSGPLRKEVQAWADHHSVSNRVCIKLINHEEMPSVLGALDILVAPSQTGPNWREQFGRMLIEAMAAGVPIVTSDSGEIPYTVGDAGLVVSEKDVDGFSKSILNILSTSDLRDELIARGLRRSLDYSVSNLAPKYGEFWSEKGRRN